ncbi:MAG: hypothetical protein JXQ29_09405 [Planctomycetes bacterium]|nr:hypothetical protein [Planctomycetota bacterium]
MRARRSRRPWVGLCGLIGLVWCGLAASTLPAGDVGDAAVRVSLHMPVRDLNPLTAAHAASAQVTDYLFDHLLERASDALDRYEGALAERWDVSDDGLVLTFQLRRGVRWHDGQPFTARDVAFTLRLCRRPELASPLAQALGDVETCEVIDDHAVRFRLARPSWRVFAVLVESAFPILPRHRLEAAGPEALAEFGRRPIGTGPYRFVRHDAASNALTLERNEHYWGDRPAIGRIVFKVLTDRAAALAEFKRGGVDFLSRLSADDFFGLLEDRRWTAARIREALRDGSGVFLLPPGAGGRFGLGAFATTRVSFVAWNCRRPPLDERGVRRALASLLDRRGFGRDPSRSLGRPVTGDQVWFGPAYNHEVPCRPLDPAAARAELEEAGWFDRDGDGWLDRAGRRLTVRITYPAQADDAVLRQLQGAARTAGVEVLLDGLEHGLFTRRKNERDFDGLYLAWVLDVEEDPYVAWHSCAAVDGANYSGFAAADALIEEARATADPARRWSLLRRLHARIDAEQPVLFVQAETLLVAWQPRLSGVRFHPLKPSGWDIREWGIADAPPQAASPR